MVTNRNGRYSIRPFDKYKLQVHIQFFVKYLSATTDIETKEIQSHHTGK